MKSEHAYQILAGRRDMPAGYHIGKACVHGHGVDEQMVRYTSNGGCVQCHNENQRRQFHDKRDLSALKAYEERMEKEDDDPLF